MNEAPPPPPPPPPPPADVGLVSNSTCGLSHLELFLSRVREQAAAEAAAKEEGHKRQKKKRGNAQASRSPGSPISREG